MWPGRPAKSAAETSGPSRQAFGHEDKSEQSGGDRLGCGYGQFRPGTEVDDTVAVPARALEGSLVMAMVRAPPAPRAETTSTISEVAPDWLTPTTSTPR